MLRKIRILFSLICFCSIILFFIGNYSILGGGLTKLQLISAVLTVNVIVLVFLFVFALLFGRLYCSFICPLGVYQDIAIWFSRKKRRGKKYFSYNRPKNLLRYAMLALAIISIVTGLNFLLVFIEPYSLFGNITTHVLRPPLLAVSNLISNVTDSLGMYNIYKEENFIISIQAILISVTFFIGIGVLAWKYGRTWCTSVCPVGSFLGLISRFSIFKIKLNAEQCTNCGLCEKKCKASCIESKEQKIDYSRCINCFDCIETCNQNAINFMPTLKFNKTPTTAAGIVEGGAMFSRAKFLNMGAIFASSLAVGLLKKSPLAATVLDSKPNKPVSPPGSISHEQFKSKCTACQLCVSRCPNYVLVPAALEYGLDGFMQPRLSFERGFCDDDCVRCGTVCPSRAIQLVKPKDRKKISMGLAVFDEAKCLVKKENEKCNNCERHCPTHAIKLEERSGKKLPVIDKDKCIGCGSCEYHCPAKPAKAFRIDGYEVHKIIKV